jgi:hypothetical protein
MGGMILISRNQRHFHCKQIQLESDQRTLKDYGLHHRPIIILVVKDDGTIVLRESNRDRLVTQRGTNLQPDSRTSTDMAFGLKPPTQISPISTGNIILQYSLLRFLTDKRWKSIISR